MSGLNRYHVETQVDALNAAISAIQMAQRLNYVRARYDRVLENAEAYLKVIRKKAKEDFAQALKEEERNRCY